MPLNIAHILFCPYLKYNLKDEQKECNRQRLNNFAVQFQILLVYLTCRINNGIFI